MPRSGFVRQSVHGVLAANALERKQAEHLAFAAAQFGKIAREQNLPAERLAQAFDPGRDIDRLRLSDNSVKPRRSQNQITASIESDMPRLIAPSSTRRPAIGPT
jgi:hypothetical protein